MPNHRTIVEYNASCFQDFQVDCRYGRGILFKLRGDYSRFPSRDAMNQFVARLKKAGKIDHLTQHICTNDPFIMDDMSLQIWANTYITELPPWTGVSTLDSVVSQTKLHQYATLLRVARDEENALRFDTYERALELAVLAASVKGDSSPKNQTIFVPAALNEACERFIAAVNSSDEMSTDTVSTDTGNSSDDLFESSSESS